MVMPSVCPTCGDGSALVVPVGRRVDLGRWSGGKLTGRLSRPGSVEVEVRWSNGAGYTIPRCPVHWCSHCPVPWIGGAVVSFLDQHRSTPSKGVQAGPLTGVLADLPAVREFLTSDRYPDDSPRERSTFTAFCEDGVVKVCLSDRDQGRTLWRTGRGVEDALLMIEAALVDGTADWRRSGGVKPQGRAGKGGAKG